MTVAAAPVAAATTPAVGRRPDRPPEAPSGLSAFFLVENHEESFFLGFPEVVSDTSVASSAAAGLEGDASALDGCSSVGGVAAACGVAMDAVGTSGDF